VYDNSAFGESCYRLMTRTGQFIYLKTRGCLEVDNVSNKAHSFVCINSLVSEDEGKKLVREMKKNFSVLVNSTSDLAIESEEGTVENPQEIERAVLNLITNLHAVEGDNDVAVRNDDYDTNIEKTYSDSTKADSVHGQPPLTKSPPLLIIAPNANTIKTTITKATNVIVTANKNKIFVAAQQHTEIFNKTERPSVLQRTENYSNTSGIQNENGQNNSSRFHQSRQHLFQYEYSRDVKIEPPSSPASVKHESHLQMSPSSIPPESPNNLLFQNDDLYSHQSINFDYQPRHTNPNLYSASSNLNPCSPPFYSSAGTPAPPYNITDERSNCYQPHTATSSVLKRGHSYASSQEDYMPSETVKKRHTLIHRTDENCSMISSPFNDINNTTGAGMEKNLLRTVLF
jgi:hypothetical protein